MIDEITKLMGRGFCCYLEYEVDLEKARQKRIIPDIYAKRKTEEIIVEIGTLSGGINRLDFLKQLFPKAKLIHVQQWKNYGITDSVCQMAGLNWKRQIRMYGAIIDASLGNQFFTGGFNCDEPSPNMIQQIQQREQDAAMTFMAKQIKAQKGK